jgi:hypothetical protein
MTSLVTLGLTLMFKSYKDLSLGEVPGMGPHLSHFNPSFPGISSLVTPTFCKNKIFCANWSAYKNAYQIIVLAKNFPKIILHRMHCMAYYIFIKSLRSLVEFRKNPHVKIPPKSPSTIFQSLAKFENLILIRKSFYFLFLTFGPAGLPFPTGLGLPAGPAA